MEDLLEEIVGDIWDEDEEIEHNYYKIGQNEFLVNGDLELDDMLALFDLDEDYIDSDSITDVYKRQGCNSVLHTLKILKSRRNAERQSRSSHRMHRHRRTRCNKTLVCRNGKRYAYRLSLIHI